MASFGQFWAVLANWYPPVWHSVWLLLLYGALDGHPFFPSHVASGRCFLSAAAAGALAGVVSAFAEPSSWCVGTVLGPPPPWVGVLSGGLGSARGLGQGRTQWLAVADGLISLLYPFVSCHPPTSTKIRKL